MKKTGTGLASILALTSCASGSNPFHEFFRSNEKLNKLPVADEVGIIDYTTEDEANNFVVINERAYLKDEDMPEPIIVINEQVPQRQVTRITNINAEYVELSDGNIALKYPSRTPAPELKTNISSLLPEINIEVLGNNLMMTGKKESFGDFSDLVAIINQTDVPPKQVRLKLRIVEYFNDNTYDRELKLGFLKDTIESINLSLPSSASPEQELAMGLDFNPLSIRDQRGKPNWYTGELIPPREVYKTSIKFLNSFGETNTLADLDILVSNTSPAVFTNQSEIPFPESTLVGSNIIETLKYKPTGVMVKMTPYANEEGFITLKIEQAESGEQSGFAGTVQQPIFRTAKLQSEFIAREGLTYLVATSLFTRYHSVNRGIPGLDKLKIIKHIASARAIESNQSQLLYFAEARVLPRDSLVGIQMKE